MLLKSATSDTKIIVRKNTSTTDTSESISGQNWSNAASHKAE